MILTASAQDLEEIIQKSRTSDRKRAFKMIRSANIPENIPAIMLNAFQPGTYVQPHMHPEEDGREIWIPNRGLIVAVIFDENGNITERHPISPYRTPFIEIPARTFHTALSLEKDSVMCELYLGLYNQGTYKSFAPWAPNGKEEHKEYLSRLITLNFDLRP